MFLVLFVCKYFETVTTTTMIVVSIMSIVNAVGVKDVRVRVRVTLRVKVRAYSISIVTCSMHKSINYSICVVICLIRKSINYSANKRGDSYVQCKNQSSSGARTGEKRQNYNK